MHGLLLQQQPAANYLLLGKMTDSLTQADRRTQRQQAKKTGEALSRRMGTSKIFQYFWLCLYEGPKKYVKHC